VSLIKKNLIAGEWKLGAFSRPNINPSNTADTVGEFAEADVSQVERAVAAARAALPAWRFSSPQARADLLDEVGSKIIARKQSIGELLSREEGKTLAEGIAETVRAGQIFKFFAQEALRVTGDYIASLRVGVDVEVTREPVGVVGLITPWNFPIAIPAWKIAPALAYGNAVLVKPANLTPGCVHILAELLQEAGCPAGVFNLLYGPGAIVGQAMIEHPGIDAISFTGSVSVGQKLAKDSLTTMKKVQLEMGGKNPMLVMDDADLDVAIETCVNGAFYSTGQRCTATSRILVQKSISAEFCDRFQKTMRSLQVGDALHPSTQIGPVVSASQLENNLEYVELARREVGEVVGGEQLDLGVDGFYQAPAAFFGAGNDMRVSQEEIFGPCVSVIEFEDFDEGLQLANDTEFGLTAGICTQSLGYAREFKRHAEAGMVMVNLPTAGVDYHVPFGGRKKSSFGYREQGRYAAEFYTAIKTAYIA
jgi:acyl-CoA reductase-like NAD-dependent aldehyde dehydrogenase